MSTRFPQVKGYFQIGIVQKSHGTSGQLRLRVEAPLIRYVREGTYVFFNQDGSYVPYKIVGVEHDVHLVITLEDVNSKDISDSMSGKACFMIDGLVRDRDKINRFALRDILEGYTIIDVASMQHLLIRNTVEMPQQLMAVVMLGEKEVYIPLHEQLIDEVDHETRSIRMRLPEGLLDL